MNLAVMIKEMQTLGYESVAASARICQDIVLKAISKSSLSRNVTIKGGVLMRNMTQNIRRATQDMDIDFIRYSLSDQSIDYFIEKLDDDIHEVFDGILNYLRGFCNGRHNKR